MAKLLLKRYQSLYIFCSNCGERSLVEVYSDRPFWYIGPKYCFEIPDKWRCSKCEVCCNFWLCDFLDRGNV